MWWIWLYSSWFNKPNKRVELVATRAIDERYLISIAQVDNRCPFLKEGKCSIYNERFKVCSSIECLNHGKDIEDIEISNFTKSRSEEELNFTFSKQFLKSYNIKVLKLNQYLQATAIQDKISFIKDVSDVFYKIDDAKEDLLRDEAS